MVIQRHRRSLYSNFEEDGSIRADSHRINLKYNMILLEEIQEKLLKNENIY
ncbi:hypothetical protein ACWO4B_001162 [Clostridium sporogenes]